VSHLSPELIQKLSIQKGLNKRAMWKAGFRSITIINSKMFNQKVKYIHMNPVRAGLCEIPEDYRWSNCWMYCAEKFDWDQGSSSMTLDANLLRSGAAGFIENEETRRSEREQSITLHH
jgi:hypothetical protein